MFGKTPAVNPLELRKRLLIAESDLNRAQLSEEWTTLTRQARDLVHRAKTMAGWASSVALVVAGVRAWRRGGSAPTAAKSSWLQKLLNGARVAWTAWRAFHTREEDQKRA